MSANERIDQIIADALAGSPETHVAILAREVVRLREARAMVVPEQTAAMALVVNRDCGSCGSYQDAGGDSKKCDGCGGDEMPNWSQSRALASARAIPADRVLGEGMAAVEREELAELLDLVIMIQADEDAFDRIETATEPILQRWEKRYPIRAFGEMIAFRDALRANQGGADHD